MNNREEKYLIWSIEHTAWWGPDRSGYVASWPLAGAYSIDEAFRISAQANWASLNEVPVPVTFFGYQMCLHAASQKVKP